ncbi:DUF6000 family protein [Flammeovirga sp. OC4]|uniref:DUF6000 family protein n=1 Tax=Flammeovirga sp. OC4 TaxID=1382345 RepID=UPI0005C436A2|nr:DUF6000 family protein [Flammeovirga sp. OC4]
MTESELYSKYIIPYYGVLMRMNFLRRTNNQITELFNSLIALGNELSDEILIELLNDSWRPSKVSAWMIGLSKRHVLTSEIEKYLNKPGTRHGEHALINLLLLKKDRPSEYFIKFIKQQIAYLIENENKLVIEDLSIEWAIAIISYLDKIYHTNYLCSVYNSFEWNEFIKLDLYSPIKNRFEPSYHEEKIVLLMEYVK